MPSLTEPGAGTVPVTWVNGQFRWSSVPAASYHHLFLTNHASPGAPEFERYYTTAETGCGSGGTCTAQLQALLAPGTYSWWVRGWNGSASNGPWSAASTFTIPALGQATLLAPSGTTSGGSVEYSWTRVAHATEHYLFVTANATGTPVIQTWYPVAATDCPASGSTCRITPGTTLPAGSYTWWIQAWSPASGFGPWSSGVVFTRP